jgi:hypothetical protein
MVPIIPKQRLHKPNAAKRFNSLIEYLQGEQERNVETQAELPDQAVEVNLFAGALGGDSSVFDDVLTYATAPTETTVAGEKCVGIRTHGVTGIASAAIEMNSVARRNARVLDPVYHFILSWPEHESPPHDAIFDAAEHAIKSLGFGDHQYVVAIHANTDNTHCHVAVNRVHPTTFKSHHIEWAKRTLHFAARESEIKHGWTHDNGIYVVAVDGHGKKQIVLNKKHAEAVLDHEQRVHPEMDRDDLLPTWHDPDSLTAWLRTGVSSALKQALPELTSWQALHVWLEQHGIELQDTGGGGLRLRAVAHETGEIIEAPVSKGLRLIRRPELEKRWGAFAAPFTNPVITPDFSDLSPKQIRRGINRVIRNAPDRGIPPPDHITRLAGDPARPLSPEGRGVHAVPDRGVATGGQVAEVLLPGAVPGDLGDEQAGQDPRVRRADAGGARSAGRGLAPAPDGAGARRPRNPELRAQRKLERAAARADLRQRFARYNNFVKGGDTEYFLRLKALRAAKSNELRAIREEAQVAKAAVQKTAPIEERLMSFDLIGREVARRRLEVEAKHQRGRDAINAVRVPPLSWREWLYEQSNRGDKAAVSALRGIVYQAQRDAKLPPASSRAEQDDLDASAADYHEEQYKRLMARLLIEERKEAAIRGSSVHAMRPHEVDALIVAHAGMRWHVTGNGNVEYARQSGQHLFTDRGNRVTFDRVRVTDEEIKLALLHSREKFGRQLTLTGDDPVFVARMARIADDLGLVVLNPELQAVVRMHRDDRKVTAGEAAKLAAQSALLGEKPGEPLAPKASTLEPKVAGRADATVDQPSDVAASGEADTLAQEPTAKPAAAIDVEQALRDRVLAIDPRARFEVPVIAEDRLYVGPVVAVAAEGGGMFVQHAGRGVYTLHQQGSEHAAQDVLVEVQYRNGEMVVRLPDAGKDRSR